MQTGVVSIPPSGRQFELSFGDQTAVVVEVGGGLRSYRVAGSEILDGYGLDEMCSSGRGQILVPWPNRIDRGRYEFGGRRLQLALTEPAKQNAIHGLARWSAYGLIEQASTHVALEHVIHAQPGYPFSVHVRLDYALGQEGLAIRTTATNIGTGPCPFGAGAHPYIKVSEGLTDEAILHCEAETWFETDDRSIPMRRAPVAGSAFDFAQPRPLGATVIDTAFTGLRRGSDGRAGVTLSSADGGRAIRVWLDEAFPYLMLFTGDTLPDPERRRRGLGVEPMTCAPNAFVTGDGLLVLESGQSFSGEWGISPGG